MNREEAHKNIDIMKLNDNFLDACDIGNLHLLINEIYDRFEKRSCDGCKHYKELYKGKPETLCCILDMDCIRKYKPKDRWESKQ